MSTAEQTDARVRQIAVGELRESPENPRRISAPRFDQLKRSIEADPLMMRARPLIALPDGTIVAGNMRYRACVELGWADVPTVVVDLDAERARTWMLRDNQGYGDWEHAQLVDLLRELDDSPLDLDLTGFAPNELQRLLDNMQHDVSQQLGAMTYSILIDCASERAQGELAARLESEGFAVKLLMA